MGIVGVADRQSLLRQLFRTTKPAIQARPWHWFQFHFAFRHPRPFARSIISAAADLEQLLTGLGQQLLNDLVSIGGREKHRPDYDTLIQKLAEMLVLRQLLRLPWPEGTTFTHEPAGTPQGKRPELLVKTSGMSYVFEVKAPSLLAHQHARGTNSLQLPGRMFPLEMVGRLTETMGDGSTTFARDNPVKDFLLSAEEKFRPFKAKGPCRSYLVIVWDDHIYEPITSLVHERCGLLTPNSFAHDKEGQPLAFPSIDAVIIIRHLLYFNLAAAEHDLRERAHAFDFGGPHSLPNVFVTMPGSQIGPAFIPDGLRALEWDRPPLQHFADYRPQELIMWLGGES